MKIQVNIALVFLLLMVSCAVDPPIKPLINDTPIETVPPNWPEPKYRFANNPLSKARFELGRALFYETLLSRDNTVSCASCHIQNFAFAQTDHAFSHGIDNRIGHRNAPALFNLTWHSEFMMDGAINHIEKQPLAPIANPLEMDESIVRVLEKLNAKERYKKLTKAAYNTDSLTSQRLLWAMTQFMGLIYSHTTKYDAVKNGQSNSAFTESEQRGYQLFQKYCNSCHREPLFTDFNYRSNGLPPHPVIQDSGRAMVTGLTQDRWKFKTPSLRNVALTYPYMHDGRFSTLTECLNHYRNGLFNTQNIDPLLNQPIRLNDSEVSDIIQFLNTLSDYSMIYDQRFSDPNRIQ